MVQIGDRSSILAGVGYIGGAASHAALVDHVRQVAKRIDDGIGLGCRHGERSTSQRHGQSARPPPEAVRPGAVIWALAAIAQEPGQRQRQSQRRSAGLGGDGQPKGQPGHGAAADAEPLRGPQHQKERQHRQARQHGIHGVKVG